MHNTPNLGFPFAAIMGQDELRLALILNAISPQIGGVVVRGEKGTAKTTMVRAFAELIPQAPFINMPLGASEDRVVGSIDVETVLTQGKADIKNGLLAQADGGILYIDEVNLLADHLADVVLDAATSGQVLIERDGVGWASKSSFVLVGTMNPEEGELRPQLLDRFGMAVDVRASRDVAWRSEIVRRRLAFESDPQEFRARWAGNNALVAEQIDSARRNLDRVEISEEQLLGIADLCAQVGVAGMRADIALAVAAQAHAAWVGRTQVETRDIDVVAGLVLKHRARNVGEQELEEMLDGDTPSEASDTGLGDSAEQDLEPEDAPVEMDTSGVDNPHSGGKKEQAPEGAAFSSRLLQRKRSDMESSAPGRRSATISAQGANIRPRQGGYGLNMIGTIQAAVDRGAQIVNSMLEIQGSDLRGSVRRAKESHLIVIVVDTSGSMAAAKRVESVTVAITSMLKDAYQRRDKVAVIAAGGKQAEVVLPPTRSIELAQRRMRDVMVGGRTPLADALFKAHGLIAREHLKEPGRRALLLVLSDGQDTSPAGIAGVDANALKIVSQGLAGSIVIDCEKRGRFKMGLAQRLSDNLNAPCIDIADMSGDNLLGAIAV